MGTACSEMARELNGMVHERALNEVGRLEQEVVFDDAKGKDLIKLFGERAGLATQDKVINATPAFDCAESISRIVCLERQWSMPRPMSKCRSLTDRGRG